MTVGNRGTLMTTIRPTAPALPRAAARPAAAVVAPAVAKPPAAAPRPVKPIQAQGPIKTAGAATGGLLGTIAGTGSGLLAAFIMAWGHTPGAIIVAPLLVAAGAALGGFGGKTLGDFLERGQAALPKATGASITGGVLGGVVGAAGGWITASLALSNLGVSVVVPFAAPVALLVGAFCAFGGAELLQKLAKKAAG